MRARSTSISYPRVLPATSRTVNYTYDAVGRLQSVGEVGIPYASGFQYGVAGHPTTFSYGNNITATYTYTPATQQLASIAYGNLLSLTYGYQQPVSGANPPRTGNNGAIQSVTDSLNAARSVTFTYDRRDRLVQAQTSAWTLNWTYDQFGNRLSQSGPGIPPAMVQSLSPNPSSNKLPLPDFEYDSAGNMKNLQGTTVLWDAAGRAVSVTSPNGATANSYDGNLVRVRAVTGSSSTVSVYGGPLLAEFVNGATTPKREYIYADGKLIGRYEDGVLRYFHQDHLSTRLVTDSSGAKYAEAGRYPFGETWYESPDIGSIKFTSYEREGDSGLDYAQMRHYGWAIGRFLSPDPVGGGEDPQSWNRYTYVTNDPVNLIDPLGLSAVEDCFNAGGVVYNERTGECLGAGGKLLGLFGGLTESAGVTAPSQELFAKFLAYTFQNFRQPTFVPPNLSAAEGGGPGAGDAKASPACTFTGCLAECAKQHWVPGAAGAGLMLGGTPVPKSVFGRAVVGKATPITSLFGEAATWLPRFNLVRVNTPIVEAGGAITWRATASVTRVASRWAFFVGYGMAVYDGATIGRCTALCQQKSDCRSVVR